MKLGQVEVPLTPLVLDSRKKKVKTDRLMRLVIRQNRLLAVRGRKEFVGDSNGQIVIVGEAETSHRRYLFTFFFFSLWREQSIINGSRPSQDNESNNATSPEEHVDDSIVPKRSKNKTEATINSSSFLNFQILLRTEIRISQKAIVHQKNNFFRLFIYPSPLFPPSLSILNPPLRNRLRQQ